MLPQKTTISNNPPEIFSNHDLMPYIFSFLSYQDLLNIKLVSHEFNFFAKQTIENLFIKAEFSAEEIATFETSSCYIKKIIMTWLSENKNPNKISKLLKAFSLPYKERIPFLFPNDNRLLRISSSKIDELSSEAVAVFVSLDLLSADFLLSNQISLGSTNLCNRLGMTAVSYGLLSEKDIDFFKYKNCLTSPHNNLKKLLSLNGIVALQEKLLTPKEASNIDDLAALLSTNGLKALREGLITAEQASKITGSFNLSHLLSTSGLIVLKEKLITPEQAAHIDDLQVLLSKNGLKALREGLITPDQAAKFHHSGTATGPKANLHCLLWDNGLIALKEKLITPEQAVYICDLQGLLSEKGLKVLREGLITPDQVTYISNITALISSSGLKILQENLITTEQASKFTYHGHLESLLNDFGFVALKEKLITPEQAVLIRDLKRLLSYNGLQALREGLITPEQAAKIYHSGSSTGPFQNLEILLSDSGLIVLREKLITPEQAAYIPNLKVLISHDGIKALRGGFIIPEQAAKFTSSWNLEGLLSDYGMLALKEKLINIEQAASICGLKELLTLNGIKALRECLITPEQVKSLPNHNFYSLFSANGFKVLREGLFTKEDFTLYGSKLNLNILLNNVGIIALRKKLITPKESVFINRLDNLLSVDNPNIIKAMEFGLINLSDFRDGGKYSKFGFNIKSFTQQLLSSYKPPFENNKITNQAATTIQAQCRTRIARRKLCLFKEIRVISQKSNFNFSKELNDIKTKVGDGKIHEASHSLARLKSFAL